MWGYCFARRCRSSSGAIAAGVFILAGCGASDDGSELTEQKDASVADATGWPDTGAPGDAGNADAAADAADATDATAAPEPISRAPCEVGRCWLNAPALSGACGTAIVHEDFGTGLYNVHRFPLAAPAGVSVEATLQVTGGSWSPALIVQADGTTLYDGEHALVGDSVKIDALASGQGKSSASVRITAQVDTPLHVFVTSWEVIDDGFAPQMPSGAAYTLTVFADCPAPSATCPMHPDSITKFASGYFTSSDSDDPSSPNYNPYKRDKRTQHSGYDLEAPLGTQVLATQNGKIVSATTTDTDECGLSVNLAADSGVTFRYCHLQSVLVTSGSVQVGQVIGLNGKSGNANLPHVHFAYLDAPNVTGSGTDAQKSVKVNQYVDNLCR
jgi:murein DD-endopeptidase MepM/ murein hydrolase activator NlpD